MRRDDAFYFDYHQATRRREGFEQWLDNYVYGMTDHAALLARLGEERMERLQPRGNLFAAAVSFNY
jgi:hypothetical protein